MTSSIEFEEFHEERSLMRIWWWKRTWELHYNRPYLDCNLNSIRPNLPILRFLMRSAPANKTATQRKAKGCVNVKISKVSNSMSLINFNQLPNLQHLTIGDIDECVIELNTARLWNYRSKKLCEWSPKLLFPEKIRRFHLGEPEFGKDFKKFINLEYLTSCDMKWSSSHHVDHTEFQSFLEKFGANLIAIAIRLKCSASHGG